MKRKEIKQKKKKEFILKKNKKKIKYKKVKNNKSIDKIRYFKRSISKSMKIYYFQKLYGSR